jgi:hypothetical protein
MRLKEVKIGQCIINQDYDGQLYFIPERIEEHVVHGYSMYVPAKYNTEKGRLENRTVIHIGSYPAIYDGRHKNKLFMLRHFKPVDQEISIQRLVYWIFELKVWYKNEI